MRRFVLSALAASAALVLTSCAASSGGGAGDTSPAAGDATSGAPSPSAGATTSAPSCSPSTMSTQTSGKLTVATDSPAYGPWFVDDKPSNGKGFESAVAYAVAKQLGYATDEVTWKVAAFNSVISPAPKQFDFDINEVSITSARAKVVDFSSGYYDVAQSIVTLKNNKYANATSIADLHGAKLAAQKGTTSFDAINNVIKPGRTPAEFPTNDLAVAGAQERPGGRASSSICRPASTSHPRRSTDAKIVGQLPVASNPEQFGLVLEKDSPLTSCVTQAVDALRANGTLEQLQQTWLASAGNAPELK